MKEQNFFPEDEDAAPRPADTLPLLNYLDELDPGHTLADPAARAELLIDADPFAAAMALREVHQRIGEHSEDISDRLITLSTAGDVNHTGASPEARSDVFNYALDAAGKAAARGNLELSGRILGGTVTAMQMFSDGNKRTARAVYMLTAHGYDGSDEDRALLTETIAPVEFDATKVPIFLPYANWNIQAFLTHEHSGDPDWVGRMRDFEVKWAAQKPAYQDLMTTIREVIPDCTQPHMLTSVIQDEGIGPYILTKRLGVDISQLGGKAGIDTVALRDMLGKLTNEDAEAVIGESEALKVKYLKFLIDKTLEAAEAGDAIKGTPADHVNITGKPLMDAAYITQP